MFQGDRGLRRSPGDGHRAPESGQVSARRRRARTAALLGGDLNNTTHGRRDMNLERLSALVDGELDPAATEAAIDSVDRETSLRGHWLRYHLISDALHANLSPVPTADLAERVRGAVAAEPTVLSPPRQEPRQEGRWRYAAGMALAASVATVAVLGFRGLEAERGADAQLVAAAEQRSAPAPGMRWDVDRPDLEAKLNGYLVNHSAYSGNGVHVMRPYVRVVGYHAGP